MNQHDSLKPVRAAVQQMFDTLDAGGNGAQAITLAMAQIQSYLGMAWAPKPGRANLTLVANLTAEERRQELVERAAQGHMAERTQIRTLPHGSERQGNMVSERYQAEMDRMAAKFDRPDLCAQAAAEVEARKAIPGYLSPHHQRFVEVQDGCFTPGPVFPDPMPSTIRQTDVGTVVHSDGREIATASLVASPNADAVIADEPMWSCLSCTRPNPAYFETCCHCDSGRRPMTVPAGAFTLTMPERSTWTCPRCHAPNNAGRKMCERCQFQPESPA